MQGSLADPQEGDRLVLRLSDTSWELCDMAGLFPACLTGASGRIMEIIVISLEDYSALVFAVWEAAVGMRGKLGCFSR